MPRLVIHMMGEIRLWGKEGRNVERRGGKNKMKIIK